MRSAGCRGTKPEAQRHAVRAGNGNAADLEPELGRARAQAQAGKDEVEGQDRCWRRQQQRAPSALEERLRRARDRGTSEKTRAIERSGIAAVDGDLAGKRHRVGFLEAIEPVSHPHDCNRCRRHGRDRVQPRVRHLHLRREGASPRRGVKPVRTPVDVRESRSPAI